MSVSSRITVVAILLATTVTMSASRVTMLVTTPLSVTIRNVIIRATTRKATVTAAAKVAACVHNVKSVQHAMSVLSVTNARPANCVQHVTLSSLATPVAHKQQSKPVMKNHVRHVHNVNYAQLLMSVLP